MIQLSGVSKSYGVVPVLRDVDLPIGQGEVVVVCGPSGSGKSTLIKTMKGLEPVQQGRIVVSGVEITNKSANLSQLRARVGMVFQQFQLFPTMSVRDYVNLAQIKVLKRTRAQASQRSLNMLARVGLQPFANRYPANLSGGNNSGWRSRGLSRWTLFACSLTSRRLRLIRKWSTSCWTSWWVWQRTV
jgi:glutamate/aspartate transport system ATP-binding protein